MMQKLIIILLIVIKILYLLMKKKSLVGLLLLLFALVSCDEQRVLNDNTVLYRQIPKNEVIYVKNVNKELAGQVATNFMEGLENVKSVHINELDSIVDWDGKTAMYIVNFKPIGFVITSADIANQPIVGYSTENNLIKPKKDGDVPDALTNLLVETIIVNNWLQDNKSDAPQHIIQENINDWFLLQVCKQRLDLEIRLDDEIIHWDDTCKGTPSVLVGETETSYGEYCKTAWGQREPYNYFAPNHYPAGCVAVAVAQIMKFHEHPDVFNWSIMPYHCTSKYSNITPGDWEVARLIRDIGAKVGMNYAPDGSGASSENARNALVYNYGYYEGAELNSYDYDRIVDEIKDQRHPIYVEGWGVTWSWRWWLFKW